MSTPELEPNNRKPTLVALKPKGSVTIPAAIRKEFGLDTDDQLIITVEDGRIVLTPALVIPGRADPGTNKIVPRDQGWFHTPEWQARETEADADKAAGRVTRYENSEDFLASLDQAADNQES
jgi:AbrB family looped-hinge helix DNA binding protein